MTSSEAIRSQMPRDVVFISHANPEDNEVTLWLALRLAREGYKVWSDLTQLIGGEDFWLEAEEAIRNCSAKFLYVLSRASNSKDGPRSELQVAKNVARDHDLRDFIVPLKVDDLPSRESNIQIAKINNIPFDSWAEGLRRLLSKLEKDGIPLDQNSGPGVVSNWWRSIQSNPNTETELLDSNWFEIHGLPQILYVHDLHREGIGLLKVDPVALPFPAIQVAGWLVSFASADDLAPHLNDAVKIKSSTSLRLDGENASETRVTTRRQVRAWGTALLQQAWDRLAKNRQLRSYELANGRIAYYMTSDHPQPQHSRHQMVGYKTVLRDGRSSKRIWHYALDARPVFRPRPIYSMAAHVLFSDDGQTIWSDSGRLHKARRSQCKDWWNGEWRGKLFAYLDVLAATDQNIKIELDSSTDVHIRAHPITFVSPVSYSRAPSGAMREPYADDTDEDEDDE